MNDSKGFLYSTTNQQRLLRVNANAVLRDDGCESTKGRLRSPTIYKGKAQYSVLVSHFIRPTG